MIDLREVNAMHERLLLRFGELDALLRDAAEGLRDGLLRERRRVHAALERLRESRYGLCCACEEPLPLERLQADPAVPFCFDCEIDISEKKDRRLARA